MDWLKSIFEYWQPSFANWAVIIIQSLIILVLGWWGINKLCSIFLLFFQKTASETAVASFLDSIIKFSLRMILIIMVLGHLGLDITSLLAAIGAAMVAIGISLKDNISNLVSGIILVISKPIHVGDRIEFENVKGTVIKVEMLFTTLQADDKNKTVIIPNARLVANNIVRQSEYDVSEIFSEYEFEVCAVKPSEIKKYFEREFILNNKILQIPAPVVEVKHHKEGQGYCLIVKLWSQNQHLQQTKIDLDRSVNKFALKNGAKLYNK